MFLSHSDLQQGTLHVHGNWDWEAFVAVNTEVFLAFMKGLLQFAFMLLVDVYQTPLSPGLCPHVLLRTESVPAPHSLLGCWCCRFHRWVVSRGMLFDVSWCLMFSGCFMLCSEFPSVCWLLAVSCRFISVVSFFPLYSPVCMKVFSVSSHLSPACVWVLRTSKP